MQLTRIGREEESRSRRMWARKVGSLSIYTAVFLSSVLLIGPNEVKAEEPPEIVWVDDDFGESTPGFGNYTFNKILDGINRVAANGTVYVHNGTYIENLVISKSLNLTGNSSSNTTISPPWHDSHTAISVKGGAVVNISGFEIVEYTNGETFKGVYVIESSTVFLRECNLTNMGHAVVAENGGILHIENNSFFREYDFEYPVYYAIAVSIRPWDTGVTGNGELSTVVNNTIVFDEHGWGVHVEKTPISLIENNTIIQNNSDWICNGDGGFDKSGAIVLYQHGTSGSSTIRSNSIQGFCWGVSTEGVKAVVENNTVSGCRICIASAAYKKEPRYPSNLTVANNSINSFTEFGLRSCNNWSYMKATNNNITDSPLAEGVRVDDMGRLDFGPNNTVSNVSLGVKTKSGSLTIASGNTFFRTGEGFHSEGTDTIHHNEFYSNEEGIRVQGNANREISNNTIVGSYKRAGIWIYGSLHNKKIWFNEISQGYRGIWITGASGNNDIKWNNISDNDYGIHLEATTSASPNPNLLQENNISFGNYGIYIDQSDRTTIQNNDIANNYESGIYISSSEFTNITRSNVTNNYIGIDVHSSSSTLVNDTSIIGNVLWAINSTDIVDATDNYFGTNDSFRIDKLVSENVNYSNWLWFRESGVNYTDGPYIISSDTEFTQGHIVNGSLVINPNVKITFTNQTGHNFIQVNGLFVTINNSVLKASYGNFTLLATNGSLSTLSETTFERQMGIGIQTSSMLVTGCTFVNGTSGIVVNQGTSNTIQDSDIIRNSRYGIYLFGSSGNTIEDNFIAVSRNGVQAYNSTLDSLSWNNISANDRGIVITDSSYASIQNNNITNNYIGVETRISLNTLINNNSIVGNVLLAILDGEFSFGTNAQNNYFGTDNSSQIEKLCEGVSCSGWINYTHPNFEYIYGDITWDTPRDLTKGVIVNGDLTIEDTQVRFNSPLYQDFIQVNWKMEINFSQIEGKEGNFTILYLNQSSGGLENSILDNFRGFGVQSESGFLTVNSTFSNGTYGMVLWKARFSQVKNSVFESNVEWSVGLFVSDQNNISTSKISNSSIGVYIYASRNNTFYSNEIHDNPVGTWLDSKRLSIMAWDPFPKDNIISSGEFYDNDVGVLATNSLGNIVSSNTFSSDLSGTGVELSGTYSQNMSLDSNTFKDNEYGVLISESTKNEIDNNTFINNTRPIEIDHSRYMVHPPYTTNNVVTSNNISVKWGNSYGIRVFDSEFNLIENNTISTSGGPTGILIEYSDNNTFSNNNVSSSTTTRSGRGVRLRYGGGNNLSNNMIANFRYNFGVEGESLWDFVQYIDSNNTVDGRKIYYWANENGNNCSYNSDGGYYGFVNSSYMWVGNVSTMHYNLQDILIAYSDNITLFNMSASDAYNALQVYKSINNTIANSTFSYSSRGVYLNWSHYNVFSNITSRYSVGGRPARGVYFLESHHNVITNNSTISHNYPGIEFDKSSHNTISYSNITENAVQTRGIYIKYSSWNNITRCNITKNHYYAIQLQDAKHTNITNNSIIDNEKGINVYVAQSTNNRIVNNEIAWNVQYGVLLEAPSNYVILNNISNTTLGYAVKIVGAGGNWVHHNSIFFSHGINMKNSNSNSVSDNYILYSPGYGIKIEGSSGNVITHNNISNSSYDGVYIDGSSNNPVTYNNITYNSGYGVKVTSSNAGQIDVYRNNFVCNKGDCNDPYQGYDDYVTPGDPIPPHFWNDTIGVGNYWTDESWSANPGFDYGEYWLLPTPIMDGNRDCNPQANPIVDAGPR